MSQEFLTYNSPSEITELVKGKIVESVSVEDERADEWLVIGFADGTKLRVRYSYLYEWEIVPPS